MVRVLTVKEYAAIMRVKERTVRAACASGRIKAVRFGGTGGYRIPETSLPDVLRDGDRETSAQRRARARRAVESVCV